MAQADGDSIVASWQEVNEQRKQVEFRHTKADVELRASEEHQS
jgi:hypothetical protein